jgi:signal transduction histidine kinase
MMSCAAAHNVVPWNSVPRRAFAAASASNTSEAGHDVKQRMTTDSDSFTRAFSLAVHELRTPVTVVAGYLRMLLKEQAGPITPRQRKMLEEAERSCGRIGSLIAEMSELGKLESRELGLARQPFDMAALVAELASDMHEGNDRGVTLEVRGCERPIEVVGDRVRLGAAIGTLMRAAMRERGEPGLIIAECSTIDGSPRSAVVAIGDEATLGAVKAAAGDPGFDEWRGGLGLALPVARRVIDAHGGALWSAPGDRPRAGSALRIPLRG